MSISVDYGMDLYKQYIDEICKFVESIKENSHEDDDETKSISEKIIDYVFVYNVWWCYAEPEGNGNGHCYIHNVPESVKDYNFLYRYMTCSAYPCMTNIPRKYRDKKMIIAAIKSGYNEYFNYNIPDEMWDDELIDAVIHTFNDGHMKLLPDRFKTDDFYQKIAQTSTNYNGMFRLLPSKYITQQVCQKAFDSNPAFISKLQPNFITQEMSTKILSNEKWQVYVSYLPAQHRTQEILFNHLVDNYVLFHDIVELCGGDADKSTILRAVTVNWKVIKLLSMKQRLKNACTTAIKQSPCALMYLPKRYKTQQICNECFDRDATKSLLKWIPDEYKCEEMCLEYVKADGKYLEFVPDKCKSETICLTAFENGCNTLKFLINNKSECSFSDDFYTKLGEIPKLNEKMKNFSVKAYFSTLDISKVTLGLVRLCLDALQNHRLLYSPYKFDMLRQIGEHKITKKIWKQLFECYPDRVKHIYTHIPTRYRSDFLLDIAKDGYKKGETVDKMD